MPRELEIRIATAQDIDAVLALETLAFPQPWRREFFISELYASGRFNLVARQDGKLVGYVFAMWIFDEMHINKIAVIPEARRLGVAAALMERCLDFASSQRIRLVSLEVRQSNEAAQYFYRQLRFETSYVRPRYYPDGEAALVMTLDLD